MHFLYFFYAYPLTNEFFFVIIYADNAKTLYKSSRARIVNPC